MMKRIIVLVFVSSLISAGILFLGTTLMGEFSPALASSQSPLIAGTDLQTSMVSLPEDGKISQKIQAGVVADKIELSAAVKNDPISPTSASQHQQAPISSSSQTAPTNTITIAQLLATPVEFIDKVFIITGIATRLSDEHLLLNDGTGEIIVEVDNDLANYIARDGQSITVNGKFDDSSSHNGYELEAWTITDETGTVVVDDCYDDCIDDLDDGNGAVTIDDCNDDCVGCSDDCDDDVDDDLDDDLDDD
jgi:uncharacterized protein YdeI (BOF family)